MSSIRSVIAKRAWPGALVLSLCLHAVTLVTLFALTPLLSGSVEAQKADLIQFELVEPAEPTSYSSLPEDRASEKPERADFLSNVTSRAADRTPGGNESMPRAQGETELPMVGLEPRGGESSPPPAMGNKEPQLAPSPSGGEMARRGAAGETPRVDAETARRAREKALLLQG